MQRFLILVGSGAFALFTLVVGLKLSATSVPAALTVMAACAVLAIGVIVLIVREAHRPKPAPAAAADGQEVTNQARSAT